MVDFHSRERGNEERLVAIKSSEAGKRPLVGREKAASSLGGVCRGRRGNNLRKSHSRRESTSLEPRKTFYGNVNRKRICRERERTNINKGSTLTSEEDQGRGRNSGRGGERLSAGEVYERGKKGRRKNGAKKARVGERKNSYQKGGRENRVVRLRRRSPEKKQAETFQNGGHAVTRPLGEYQGERPETGGERNWKRRKESG